MLVTPVLVIVIMPVVELAVVLIPVLPTKVLYGLAVVNSVLKLVAALVNAEYNEIIVSAATVDNVQIITAITAAQLNQVVAA